MTPAPPPPPVSPFVRLLCTPWTALKRKFLRRRIGRAVFERIRGREFAIWPGVFNPVVFRTGRFLAEYVARAPQLEPSAPGQALLDMGTGCGVLGVFAAVRGYQVTAVDVVPEAASCARANAILNHVQDRMEVLAGDLFAPVEGRAFDVVLFSLPKFRGVPRSGFERTWRSPDIIDRFAAGVPSYLKPDGVAYFVLTSHGDCRGVLDGLANAGLLVERLFWRHFGVETMAIYAARRRSEVIPMNRATRDAVSKVGVA